VNAVPDMVARENASAAIKSLRTGQPPDPSKTDHYGPWASGVRKLEDALGQGGLGAVERALSVLTKLDRSWADLVLPDTQSYRTQWTVTELLATEFDEPQWAVPGMLPIGLSFLAGRPKVGKSWMALQLAHAVGSGGTIFGQTVERGKVLYLALEDSLRRLKERLQRQRVAGDVDITFRTEWKRLTEGGVDELRQEIERCHYTLVIVDTLSRLLGRADQQDIAEMTSLVGDLQRAALMHGVAILLVDHHRKPAGFEGNPVDDIMGSSAKAAVADALLGLFKEQGRRGATLKIVGRDVEEREFSLDWDPLTCSWQLSGGVQNTALLKERGEVFQVVGDCHPNPAYPTEIANSTKMPISHVSKALGELADSGLVRAGPKEGKRVPYTLTDDGLKLLQGRVTTSNNVG
jgi:DNA-binding transcriptional ArsR family regulator